MKGRRKRDRTPKNYLIISQVSKLPKAFTIHSNQFSQGIFAVCTVAFFTCFHLRFYVVFCHLFSFISFFFWGFSFANCAVVIWFPLLPVRPSCGSCLFSDNNMLPICLAASWDPACLCVIRWLVRPHRFGELG